MPRQPNSTRAPAFKALQRKLGRRFKKIREADQESKSGMAGKLGVSSMTIANWEKGDSVTLYTLFVYAKYQKKSIDQLIADHAS